MNVIIETERFFLREIVAEDAQGFYELDSDPEVHKYLGNSPVKALEESQQVIKWIQQQYKENGLGRLAIIDKNTNDFVGWSGLKYEKNVRKEFNYYDLGYRLKRAYWGKGIATETAIASLKYGFQELNLKEICAAAHVDNIASNKILSKVGLELTDTLDLYGDPHNWYVLSQERWVSKIK